LKLKEYIPKLEQIRYKIGSMLEIKLDCIHVEERDTKNLPDHYTLKITTDERFPNSISYDVMKKLNKKFIVSHITSNDGLEISLREKNMFDRIIGWALN